MSSSISNLVDNLAESLHNDKCTDCKSCLECISTENELLKFKCLERSQNHKKHFNKDLIKRFANTYGLCALMLRKGVNPCEYIDSQKRFDGILFSDKEDFYSNLNKEDITDADYKYAKKWKDFKIKHLGEYHDLYVQSDTLLRADVFENFINKCIEIYELDPKDFLSAPGLAWQACLKKTEVGLELLTGISMLLMVRKGIRGGTCNAIQRCAAANNKYMKKYNNDNESSYIMYLDANNLYGWEMSQKLPVDGFV